MRVDMANKKLVLFSTIAFVFLFIIALGCAENNSDEAPDENVESDSNGESGISQGSTIEENEENDSPSVSQNATISISSPSSGDTVKYRELVSGSSSGVYGSDLHLYVLVNPIESGEEWWIQTEATVSSDGSWQTIAQFGEDIEEHIGKEYRVSAIVTSDELSLGKLDDSPLVECRTDKDIMVIRG
jgi:hypothetical protein